MTDASSEPTDAPEPSAAAEPSVAPRPKALDLDVTLVPDQTTDDTDAGWGSESRTEKDPATVLRRYLDEKPPHHGD